ncbi:MAG: ATP-NAD kinase family protein [Hyphomicrobiales bacterium]|nr:ATP-NAD kinase family protein [Hyphomicrobiales bacterium]MCP5001024.1 ATP-NAD kinase family protein [Hyphomicrobiales bacterium]
MKTIGFLINPIAGMGGRVGLKGTDGVADQAKRLGAEPLSEARAAEMLAELQTMLNKDDRPQSFRWVTCSGPMGARALWNAGFENVDIVFHPNVPPSEVDTRAATRAFMDAGADLVVFCGGDGTARDVCCETGTATPMLGIPAGVKMYSGVFGMTPLRTSSLVIGFLRGELDLIEAEILDVDEDRYREGAWVVRLYHKAKTPFEPTMTQAAKAMFDAQADAAVKEEIAQQLGEEMNLHSDRLYILGPGGTVQFVADKLGIEKTLLGIDVVCGGVLVARDVNEQDLLRLLDAQEDANLILSPIGVQGFVLGRGNLQISPDVVKKIGHKNIWVIATPAKLARTAELRFDTGDAMLDAHLAAKGFWPVAIGYHKRRMVKVSG